MWEDPIVAEVRNAREELYKEFGYSMDALFEHFKKTQAEHRSAEGCYVPPNDATLKVAEESPEYKTGKD